MLFDMVNFVIGGVIASWCEPRVDEDEKMKRSTAEDAKGKWEMGKCCDICLNKTNKHHLKVKSRNGEVYLGQKPKVRPKEVYFHRGSIVSELGNNPIKPLCSNMNWELTTQTYRLQWHKISIAD